MDLNWNQQIFRSFSIWRWFEWVSSFNLGFFFENNKDDLINWIHLLYQECSLSPLNDCKNKIINSFEIDRTKVSKRKHNLHFTE